MSRELSSITEAKSTQSHTCTLNMLLTRLAHGQASTAGSMQQSDSDAEGSGSEPGSTEAEEGSGEASGGPADDSDDDSAAAAEPAKGPAGGLDDDDDDDSDDDELVNIVAEVSPEGQLASGSYLDSSDLQQRLSTATVAEQGSRITQIQPAMHTDTSSPVSEPADSAIGQAPGQTAAKRSRQVGGQDSRKRAKVDAAIPETYEDFKVGAHPCAAAGLVCSSFADLGQMLQLLRARAPIMPQQPARTRTEGWRASAQLCCHAAMGHVI